MLVSEMITRVRESLHDIEGDRLTDARIIGAINLGILDLRRERPDYFIGRYNGDTYQAKKATETYDLPEITIPPIIKYAIGWIEMADEEVSDQGRAAMMMSLYKSDTNG